jgi:arsenate reductase (thioredoxin)
MPHNILILCTGNSARSILGEAIFNRLGGSKVHAFSAGSQPKGAVNPGAVRLLEKRGLMSASFGQKAGMSFRVRLRQNLISLLQSVAMLTVRCVQSG